MINLLLRFAWPKDDSAILYGWTCTKLFIKWMPIVKLDKYCKHCTQSDGESHWVESHTESFLNAFFDKQCNAKKWSSSKSSVYLVVYNTLPVPSPSALCEVIDGGELNQGWEDESIADGYEPVHGSGIGHLWKRVSCTYAQCCHCENGGYTWKCMTRNQHLWQLIGS